MTIIVITILLLIIITAVPVYADGTHAYGIKLDGTIGNSGKLDDNATSQIIEKFYRQYMTTDISKAKALQNAQIKLIYDKKFEHPIFWAPFLLIGNWM